MKIKKPSLKGEYSLKGGFKHLGHFAQDKYIQQGHNDVADDGRSPAAMLSDYPKDVQDSVHKSDIEEINKGKFGAKTGVWDNQLTEENSPADPSRKYRTTNNSGRDVPPTPKPMPTEEELNRWAKDPLVAATSDERNVGTLRERNTKALMSGKVRPGGD